MAFRYLYVGESGSRVVAEAAHHLTSVTVVIRMTSVWRIEAEVSAFVRRSHVLVHGVDRFQNAPVQLLEFAQFGWLLYAVVFHVLVTLGGLEGVAAGHGDAIHVGKLANSSCVQEVGRSEIYYTQLLVWIFNVTFCISTSPFCSGTVTVCTRSI